ncbi:hypothetical protein RF11_06457 [Thelohanellus kitauei]|uniref:Peptidase S9 prolyl oligopeptidase catalytic domain-containing protein n=1 Tax=Thelohanellus kitauei TaxID=669202 RepID=A0A0C2N8K3_THEKT|nr:hypothetical protein RF11_06457 [Thelohanellus kitauei]
MTGISISSMISIEVDDLERLQKMSPMYYAKQIQCPVLLLLSTGDKQLSIQQGLQIFRSLKSWNQDVTFIDIKDQHQLQSVESQTIMTSEILKFISRISAQKS